jgi:hypothetical protein
VRVALDGACQGTDAWACDDSVGAPQTTALGLDVPFTDGQAHSEPEPVYAGDGVTPYVAAFEDSSAEYALIQPLLLCPVEGGAVCSDAMVDELGWIALGFNVEVMHGPEGFGIYLTYADDATDEEYSLVHPLFLCSADGATICDESMADEMDLIALAFDILVMDGTEGYGIYLTYTNDSRI